MQEDNENTENNEEKLNLSTSLFSDIQSLIKDAKQAIASSVNSTITITYWNIGYRINKEILKNTRANYGKQIVISLSKNLTEEYGKGWSEKHLRHCLRFAKTINQKKVYAMSRQLSWTHFRTLIYIKDMLKRDFYLEMSKMEKWNTRTLNKKIDDMLFERTAISKKPEIQIKKELAKLGAENKLTPDLVFKNPYFLNFLGLKDNYSGKTLENAILREIENFILELGQGFTFVERQKRMLIDGDSFKLDLLFYHRKLNRLVAIDLKLSKFKAAYKGQMELYLRYLEKYEVENNELSPIGLILCAEGSTEQIELLQLDKSGIRVAEYITELPSKEVLQKKLHKVIKIERSKIENK